MQKNSFIFKDANVKGYKKIQCVNTNFKESWSGYITVRQRILPQIVLFHHWKITILNVYAPKPGLQNKTKTDRPAMKNRQIHYYIVRDFNNPL